jgi:hypothetical protein
LLLILKLLVIKLIWGLYGAAPDLAGPLL